MFQKNVSSTKEQINHMYTYWQLMVETTEFHFKTSNISGQWKSENWKVDLENDHHKNVSGKSISEKQKLAFLLWIYKQLIKIATVNIFAAKAVLYHSDTYESWAQSAAYVTSARLCVKTRTYKSKRAALKEKRKTLLSKRIKFRRKGIFNN